ncbi:GTPase Era [Pseudovibrio sp. Tun.PSC04-5.I4]|uniref:GTPase Era n=1 Tax=Pseudovibrio sp. Tun.PSC04-5.I4 TaxID=1798213 RepID=UPI00088FB0FD|nr:GTPase Era [Pseudovibrio sp. Tun.PSC04-5.I4]SDR13412.1 GTP-binding protein Era [Pseudovibrio sp. Tun.PSC04-5.I4]
MSEDNNNEDDDLPEDDGLPEGMNFNLSKPNDKTSAGFVALIGAPNAGKSTLVNKLVGIKVSIVTHKVQTTRAIVRGVAMAGDSQIIFVDTPGIFRPKRRLDRAMVDTAWGGAKDADVVAVLIDAKKGIDESVERILNELEHIKLPKVLILNKIDITKRDQLLALSAKANEYTKFDQTFMVSAINGSGTKDIISYFAERMPKGPWLYPEDQVSDIPMRMLAAEVTREKIYIRLHEELPYISTVETDQWQEKPDGSVRIEQTIFVERDSQKAIVLGKNGQTIKVISKAAREELEEALEMKVHLFVFVKVRENWADDPERYRNMGLEFPR